MKSEKGDSVRGSRPRSRQMVAGFAAAIQNGFEIARFGGLGEREPSPFEVFHEGLHYRLRHYFPGSSSRSDRQPVLLVPPLMMSSEIWDVDPESSAVAALNASGADPWVVDFGSPEQEEGGLERTLTDHIVAVDQAISKLRKVVGRDVHLMGYSQGGMFAYQAAAYRRSAGVASIVTFGSAVDLHKGLPGNLPPELLIDAIDRFGDLQESLMPGGIPSWATRLGFQMMDPIKTLQQRIDFVRRLYDRESLQQKEGMRRFLQGEGWTAFPGPALRDLMKQLVAGNRMLQGGLVIDGAIGDPGGSDLSHSRFRRTLGYDRTAAGGAADLRRCAPDPGLSGEGPGRAFWTGRWLAFVGNHLAGGDRMARVARRPRALAKECESARGSTQETKEKSNAR